MLAEVERLGTIAAAAEALHLTPQGRQAGDKNSCGRRRAAAMYWWGFEALVGVSSDPFFVTGEAPFHGYHWTGVDAFAGKNIMGRRVTRRRWMPGSR